MKLSARKPSPDSFLLEYRLEEIPTSGPVVTLAWQLPFGKKQRVASVSWSAVPPQHGPAALAFANAVRSAAVTAVELTHGGVTEEQLLRMWEEGREEPWPTTPASR